MAIDPDVETTCADFMKADDDWQQHLNARFGAEAYQARYEKRGRGSFDDELGRAFLARDKARMRFEAAMAAQRAAA